jgi:hypothetical protein
MASEAGQEEVKEPVTKVCVTEAPLVKVLGVPTGWSGEFVYEAALENDLAENPPASETGPVANPQVSRNELELSHKVESAAPEQQ